MTDKKIDIDDLKEQKRLREIEECKLEIILKIANLNDNYNEKISKLNTEYSKLDKEYYYLKIALIKRKKMNINKIS
jgi:hypothetical protein